MTDMGCFVIFPVDLSFGLKGLDETILRLHDLKKTEVTNSTQKFEADSINSSFRIVQSQDCLISTLNFYFQIFRIQQSRTKNQKNIQQPLFQKSCITFFNVFPSNLAISTSFRNTTKMWSLEPQKFNSTLVWTETNWTLVRCELWQWITHFTMTTMFPI